MMNTLTILPPIQRANESLAKLVATAREKFAAEFRDETAEFDASSWDISNLKERSTNPASRRIHFTRRDTTDQALPPLYANVLKSWVILDRRVAETMPRKVDAGRMLWEAILLRRKGKSEAFHWGTLTEEDLNQAELLMREKWAASTTYKQMAYLLVLTRFLAARGVCRTLHYTPHTPRIEDFNRHTIAGQEARSDRLPSDAALNGLADIYRQHAKEPRDRLRAAALAILVVTGLRISELLTLPIECEVEEVRAARPRYGLRYYKEKARGAERMFAVRWLTPTGAELAREAIAEIRMITQAARERARNLEQSPHRVAIPGFHWAARMTPVEAALALGILEPSIYAVPPARLPRHQHEGGFFYRAFEVEAYLLSLRAKRLWTVNRRDGTYQMLSETLLIVPRNFFGSHRHAHPLLVEPVAIRQFSDFLSSRDSRRGRSRSAFERFGICEADGSFCEMTTHQFRHWLNDLADKGGLPTELQTRWMGREHTRDTDAYRHATADERLRWVKDGIREGKLAGPQSSFYFGLPHAQRDSYLDGEIQAVHVTPLGLCLHDFAVTPCPYHLNCIRGCSDYLRTKRSESERWHLVQIQKATEDALSSAKKFSGRGDARIAEPWIRHCEETLEGVKKALAIDDEPSTFAGDLVRASPDQPSRFEKSLG